jgi:8-oxo-dGTP pyrophosphatase MutT (NUDIX family)
MDDPIRCTARRVVHTNPWWTVRFDDVTFASGAAGRHIAVETSTGRAGAAVLAIRDDDAVALVRVFRYPLGAWCWELPRGFADTGDADAAASGVRELFEETALVAGTVVDLGLVYPDSGLLAGGVSLLAVAVTGPAVEGDDADAVAWVPPAQLWERIAAGELSDGFLLAAVARAVARGLLAPPGQATSQPGHVAQVPTPNR